MKKKKVGKPRTGRQRVRNQFKLKMDLNTFIRLDEKSIDEGYSQTVSELVMRNMIEAGFYMPHDKTPETVQVTISDDVMKHIDKICKTNKVTPTKVIMYFLEKELDKSK